MIERNSINFGDCLELMKDIPNKSVDLILADLPYGTTKARWDSIIDMPSLWKHYERVIKPNGAVLLFAQTPFDKVLGASNLKMLKYEWIWEKTAATGFYNAKKMPMKAHEQILVYYKKLPTYNPQKTEGHKPVNRFIKTLDTGNRTEVYGNGIKEVTGGGNTDRYPRSVLKYSSDKQKSCIHSAQKPVALLEYFIKTYTNPGELVLDNVAGSGSTGVACVNTGRDYILMENDKIIYDKCVKRIYGNIT